MIAQSLTLLLLLHRMTLRQEVIIKSTAARHFITSSSSNIKSIRSIESRLDRRRYNKTTALTAAPKKGGIVDSYQTVSVVCSKCRTRLFRYKKKNGMKSNLVKCYIERICEDPEGLLNEQRGKEPDSQEWNCPNCETKFARPSMIHGRPALKLVGGKVRMMKK